MPDSQKVCIHCFVSGRVQGVWFRANTKTIADKLGLTGWVRNLSDGRVEVIACGPEDKIERLQAWLKQGPERAKVEDFSCEELAWQEHSSFRVI